ncbi:MAG: 16S rRNA (adenine(1518)-N(6)/adenine(1519)-N(6))-dimethyltransferase RsmA [Gammaproteobacteria bacterium]|nr:16S rRNA (adenine(1518)-N(6)/adenine(1519)-N(6))-dimethyltransferase RsmA [Gammaproteobacteria bacterium]
MKHIPRRRFGQNFLQDKEILEKIVNALESPKGSTLLEIGPGQGALTFRLLDRGYRVIAIEIDRDLADALIKKNHPDLVVITQDVLNCNLNMLCEEHNISECIGNLPYNISTPFLIKFTELQRKLPGLFLLQKEVTDRIIASPGNKDFGRLSLAIGQFFTGHPVCFVPPTCFYPAPKVNSQVIALKPRDSAECIVHHKFFAEIVHEAFQHRRKTLRNALPNWTIDFTGAGIDPQRRPETLSEAEFNHLSQYACPKLAEI